MIEQSPLLRQLTIEEIEAQEVELAETVFKDKSEAFLKTRMWIHTHPMDSMNQLKVLSKEHPKFLDILHDPELWLRKDQMFDFEDGKDILLYLAGRSIGKSKKASFTVIKEAMREKQRISLWSPTYKMCKGISFEGDSGILETMHPDLLKKCEYNKTLLQLRFPNGSLLESFSASEFDNSRGSQSSLGLAEELAQWPEEAWNAMKMTIRLGKNPRILVLTTPRPTKLIKTLAAADNVKVVKGTTYQNYFITPQYVKQLTIDLPERMMRQELLAEVLSDNVYALFKMSDIIANDIKLEDVPFESMIRFVIGVDPAVSTNENSDLTGIVVAGQDKNGVMYIIDDKTMKGTPEQWSAEVIRLYTKYNSYSADCRIVVEKNQGGDLLKSVLYTASRSMLDGAIPSVQLVHSYKGKALRAEAPAAAVERGEVKFVSENLKELIFEMTEWNPTDTKQASPNRLDSAIFATTGMLKSPATIITSSYGGIDKKEFGTKDKVNKYCGYR
jgi:phage terminase large subunit-like protein